MWMCCSWPARSRTAQRAWLLVTVVDAKPSTIAGRSAASSPCGEVTRTITVAARSIDTKQKRRDDHLRSADFFDVDSYPVITFTVDKIIAAGTGLTVSGQLSVRGRTRRVSFDLSVSHFDGNEAHLDGELHVNRADFSLTWNRLGMASVSNIVTVQAVFTRR
jgi:polyisoprenoid-binding protein YceI